MPDRNRYALISREADKVAAPQVQKPLAATLRSGLEAFAKRIEGGDSGPKAAAAIAKATQKDLDAINEEHVNLFAARGFELAGAFMGRKGFAAVSPKVKKSISLEGDASTLASNFLKTNIAEWLKATSTVETATTATQYEILWRQMVQEGLTDARSLGRAIREFGLAGTQTRAEMMAQTISIYSYNAGAADQYRDAGIEEKEWMVTEDDALCPICRPFDGRVVKIGGVFETASKDPFGLGVQHPPLHPRCRCALLPVL